MVSVQNVTTTLDAVIEPPTTKENPMIKSIILAIALTLAGSVSLADAQFRTGPAAQSEVAPASININTANAAELARLPGIGPSKAKAIITARESVPGGFTSVDDLARVVGIGPATFAKIAPLCRI
jgi:competence protein ComEA